jgi:hypothetical protein
MIETRITRGGKTLREVIKDKGLQYKIVASEAKCTVERVCGDAGMARLSAERAIVYGRALGVDPSEFRPDIFRPNEFNFGGK